MTVCGSQGQVKATWAWPGRPGRLPGRGREAGQEGLGQRILDGRTGREVLG